MYKEQLDCALAAARAASDLLRDAFQNGYAGDLDKSAELLIRGALLDTFPRYGYRGEETGFVSPAQDESKHLWLVDPLDGTSAVKRGFRGGAVSIALLRDGSPVIGVVSAYAAPDHAGDLFWWFEGLRGIFRNGNHITRDWPAKASSSCTVLISQDADKTPNINLELVAPMRYRAITSVAYRLALVAAGEGDVGVSQAGPVSWDFAGGHALLLGAGGDLFDGGGNAITYDGEGQVRGRWSPVCFGGQRALIEPLVRRDWSAPHGGAGADSAAKRLCYLKPREIVMDARTLSRAQGCLLGQVAGDALGSLVEFQSAETIRAEYPVGPRLLADGGSWDTLAGQPTDDSELALALARSIVESNGYNEEAVARAYAGWYASGPFDVGSTTRCALSPARHAVEQGLSAATAAKGAANAASQANGALMRISPLGIFGAALPPDLIFEYARADAGLTHPHPVCRDASAVFSTTIAFAIQGGGDAVDAYEFATDMATSHDVTPPVLKALKDAASKRPSDYQSQQGWVLIALQNAFYQLLHTNFEEGVIDTVRSGGDTDTNGAIAGALLGAVHGRAEVPQQWLDRVLTCRPMARVPGVKQARPAEFWPVDALCLAERLLLTGQSQRNNLSDDNGTSGEEVAARGPKDMATANAGSPTREQMPAKAPRTPRALIIEALKDILSDEPEGLQTGELLKRIRQRIPGLVRCHHVVLDYAEEKGSDVYKPTRGLFRHVKYRSQPTDREIEQQMEGSAAEFADILYAASQLHMTPDDVQRAIAGIYDKDGNDMAGPEIQTLRERIKAQIACNKSRSATQPCAQSQPEEIEELGKGEGSDSEPVVKAKVRMRDPSMEIPEKIEFAADRLRQGHRVNRITVRDFLRHFGAERRGSAKVEAIRRILDSHDLTTDPDFETAWIDAPIWLKLKPGIQTAPQAGPLPATSPRDNDVVREDVVLEGTPSAVQQAEEQCETAPTSSEPEAPTNAESIDSSSNEDPTFRIGSLPAANRKLVVVNQNDSLTKAITLMLQHDFSQLPVMQGEREVKGVITWKSIGSRQALGRQCNQVGDCREDARIVDSNRTLFEAIPTIVESGYVLVRDRRDRRITGIVTASDLSLQFLMLAEPFLLLREIELHVRQLLGDKLSSADFGLLDFGPPGTKKPQTVADLTFGEYVRLLQHPQVWPKLSLNIDCGTLTKLLDDVRLIRNDVMHFDPDPMTTDELGTLKRAVRFMQELFELLPNPAAQSGGATA